MMASVLTMASSVTCSDQGKAITPSTAKLTVGGKPVLLKTDVPNWTIIGCTQTGTNQVPCTKVLSIAVGASHKLTVGNVPVLLDTLNGTANGSPENAISATAKQSKLAAS